MKFGRQNMEEQSGVQLAPLIDIVFLTLVFFMTTSVFATLEREIDITLPTAQSAEATERTQFEIFINLKQDGSIVLNDRTLTAPELQDVLNRVAEYAPGGAVIIRGDRQAHLGNAIAILDACRNADIQNVVFAAVQPQPGAAP
jgi:biopolymer transport protein ExbD